MTVQAQQMVERLLYGAKPLEFVELIFRPGFINLILVVWSPIILLILIMCLIKFIKKYKEDKLLIERKRLYIVERLKDVV